MVARIECTGSGHSLDLLTRLQSDASIGGCTFVIVHVVCLNSAAKKGHQNEQATEIAVNPILGKSQIHLRYCLLPPRYIGAPGQTDVFGEDERPNAKRRRDTVKT